MKNIKKWDIYYANLNPVIGSEQGGVRPVVILQNDIGNKYSTTVVVAPITKICHSKPRLPTHVNIFNETKYKSVILLEQIRVIDKKRIYSYIGKINSNKINEVNIAIDNVFNYKKGKVI